MLHLVPDDTLRRSIVDTLHGGSTISLLLSKRTL